MKVYYSASMSKNRNLLPLSQDLVKIIESLGHEVITKIVVDPNITAHPDWARQFDPEGIYKIMYECLEDADVLITEATLPSFGAGWWIDYALKMKKPVLTLHYADTIKRVPIMIQGRAKEINLHIYTEETVREIIENFFKKVKK